MLKIILIRPGASDYSDQGRIQGTLDMPLNDHGADEVAHLIDDLEGRGIETIYCSTCEPAQETARNIATALDVKLKKLREFRNLDHGLWQGMLIEEVKRKQPTVYRQWQEQPECVRPPEGETLAEAMDRIDHALDKLLKWHREGTIGLVVPEPLASVVKARLGKVHVGDLWEATTAHGDWQVLEVEPQSVGNGR